MAGALRCGVLTGLIAVGAHAQTMPVLSPLETGNYVNFDSPPVKPLAVSLDGRRLLAVNTPSNWLEIFDSSDDAGQLHLVRRVPTGLEPVGVFFQPNSNDRIAWVLNFISDDITVIDLDAAAVLAVIPVGDEPVNLLFDANSEFAYVITQGPAVGTLLAQHVDPRGALSVIRVPEHAVISSVTLDCSTPRAAVYDASAQRVLVGALSSGNATTIVGHPIEFTNINGPQLRLTLEFVRDFSLTSGIFAASTLSPWPDVGSVNSTEPLVARIVPANGGVWDAITAAFTAPGGGILPQAVSAFASQFQCSPEEANRVLLAIANERAQVVDHDLLSVRVADPFAPVVTGITRGIGTTLTAMTALPSSDRLMITNMEPRNTTRLEPALRGRFMRHEVLLMPFPSEDGQVPVITHTDLHAAIPHFDSATSPNPEAQARSLANPSDIVVDPVKPRAYIAALGTDRVGVVSSENGQVLATADVGRGPRALAVDSFGRRLYCFNRTDLSISVLNIETDAPQVLTETRLMSPEPRAVIAGRNFAVTTRLSNNFSSSCAMCHIDGGFDGLAWDLGDPLGTQMLPTPIGPAPLTNHPLKGPMVTQSLRGLRNHEPFHWRGDRQSLADFSSTFDALLGGVALSGSNMAKLDAYVKSLVYPPNPFYNRDNKPISPRISQGFTLFGTSCLGCHDSAHDGAARPFGANLDLGTDVSFLASQVMEFSQLRGSYKKFYQERYTGFGLLHDGRQGMGQLNDPFATLTMGNFFGALALDGCPGGHPEAEAVPLSNFMRAFPSNVMPVVGWQRLAASGTDAGEQAATVSTVVRMAIEHVQVPSRCDVVARGMIEGEARGWVLLPPTSGELNATTLVFLDDAGVTMTLDHLLGSIGGNSVVTFLAVPPGSGHRIGVDIDNDGCLNRLDTFPTISADWNGDQGVDGDDVIAFFAEWDAGDADFNNDGGTDGDDVIAFFAVWDISC